MQMKEDNRKPPISALDTGFNPAKITTDKNDVYLKGVNYENE